MDSAVLPVQVGPVRINTLGFLKRPIHCPMSFMPLLIHGLQKTQRRPLFEEATVISHIRLRRILIHGGRRSEEIAKRQTSLQADRFEEWTAGSSCL